MAHGQQMQQAMASRAAIEQARAFSPRSGGSFGEAAFEVLSCACQHSCRKLRDIGAEIIAGARDRAGRRGG